MQPNAIARTLALACLVSHGVDNTNLISRQRLAASDNVQHGGVVRINRHGLAAVHE